jgi:hypothetical protein
MEERGRKERGVNHFSFEFYNGGKNDIFLYSFFVNFGTSVFEVKIFQLSSILLLLSLPQTRSTVSMILINHSQFNI